MPRTPPLTPDPDPDDPTEPGRDIRDQDELPPPRLVPNPKLRIEPENGPRRPSER